jgi:hypothetical protein
MSELNRRKSEDERRRATRYEVNIEVEWESHDGRGKGTLSDISEEGCFVLSEVSVSDGELLMIFIPLTDGKKVEFMGQVANFVYEIGLAVNFLSLSEAQKEYIASFVEVHNEDQTA